MDTPDSKSCFKPGPISALLVAVRVRANLAVQIAALSRAGFEVHVFQTFATNLFELNPRPLSVKSIWSAPDDMLNMLLMPEIFPSLGPSCEVHCNEVVEMNSEYAVYVVDGEVRATCHYQVSSGAIWNCSWMAGDGARTHEELII